MRLTLCFVDELAGSSFLVSTSINFVSSVVFYDPLKLLLVSALSLLLAQTFKSKNAQGNWESDTSVLDWLVGAM